MRSRVFVVVLFAALLGLSGCATPGGGDDDGQRAAQAAMMASLVLIDANEIEAEGLDDASLERFARSVDLLERSNDPFAADIAQVATLIVIGVAAREIERDGYDELRGERFEAAAELFIATRDEAHHPMLRAAVAGALARWGTHEPDAVRRGMMIWREAMIALLEAEAGE